MAQFFISYSRENTAIVERLRQDLQKAGIDIWIDSIGLQPGTPDWDEALRVAIKEAQAVILVASPDSRRSAYVRDEIALAKGANKPIYPVWVAGDDWMDTVPMGLGSTQNVDLRADSYAQNLTSLIAALNGQVLEDETAIEPIIHNPLTEPVENPRNPYKGLRAFHEEDSNDFFGRSVLIDDLLNAIEDENQSVRLLAVLGASGSGKSSVMMAGVLPKLRQNHPDWIFLDPIVPSANPLEKLTIALARRLPQKSHSAIREDLLDRSTRGLHRLTCELSDKPVVLYIDQFEEVFTLIEKEPERRQFIDLLTTSVNELDGVLIVLLSMRADFYDRPLQYQNFGNLIKTQHIAITPMTLADLYDVVQLPAQLPDVGMSFDEGLVTEMVFAVREEAAALPLLQFTLDQLFQEREGNVLTNAAYQAIGGVQGALAQHAEATFNTLPSDQHKTLARALFLRLIEAGQTEQDTTRRRATYSELTLPDVEQTRILQATADAFVNARLLVTDQSGDNRTIEVSHEALIREWLRLGDWLRDAREDLRLQKSLSADVTEWLRRSKPDDMLYRGTVLVEAQAWTERNSASRDETMFINESVRLEQELETRAKRAARNLRYAFIGLFGVIVIASVGLALIFAQNNSQLLTEVQDIEATSTIIIADANTQVANAISVNATSNAVNANAISVDATAVAVNANAISVDATAVVLNAYAATIASAIETAIVGQQTAVANANTIEANAATAISDSEALAGTSEYQVDYLQAQVEYAATRDFALSPLDITLTPAVDFFATATAYAEFEWQPVIETIDDVEMVFVPAGCFFMGSNEFTNEQPIHEVCIEDDFWIDQYEVTNDQFETLDGEAAAEPDWDDSKQPRTSVAWFEAQAFCELRGGSLPTEAQWEYAARGANSLTYPWGNEFVEENVPSGEASVVGNYEENESWVGAYDMSGNVSEWVRSEFQPYPYATDDGREDLDDDDFTYRRVLRGGSFNFNTSINFSSLRSADRNAENPNGRASNYGFRCVVSVPVQ